MVLIGNTATNAVIVINGKPMETTSDRNKRLRELVPHGYVTTKRELLGNGFTLHQIDNLVKREQLVVVASGVYHSPETVLTWEGGVASLQNLGSDVTVGGLTSLELAGFSHYLSLGEKTQITLFASKRLPAWLDKALPDVSINYRTHARVLDRSENVTGLYRQTATGQNPAIEFTASRPELAILELLHDVPKLVSFEHADLLMEGLATLSPKRLDTVLSHCKSIKIKRLFFWFAYRHQHAWMKTLNYTDYDLGKGKRVLASPGKLDKKFQITVPKEMHAASE